MTLSEDIIPIPIEQRKRYISYFGELPNNTIFSLYTYCQQLGLSVSIYEIFNGYKIIFQNGDDVVQHHYSEGSDQGKLEFQVSKSVDQKVNYRGLTLRQAKSFVSKHKDALNNTFEKGE